MKGCSVILPREKGKMNAEFFEALDLLEKEKGISKDYMLEKIEAALTGALKREIGGSGNIRIKLDPNKKDMRVYRVRTVVEEVTDEYNELTLDQAKAIAKKYKMGDTVETEIKTKNFGRLSAQTAKQVIIQGIREAERANIAREYESKREEIVSAVVVKVDPTNGAVVLDTGTSNAVLVREEQIPGEIFEVGDRVKVIISEVNRAERGPIVKLSRIHSSLVRRMFELEVPEIQEGTVVIQGVSREAGSRSKIAVMSTDENVDAIGSCIGNRGMRINSIIDELCGEKIDIVKYSEDPCEFVAAALSPARVESVTMDGERSCKVIVSPDQLSLAIGKEGQNARLAARLTGMKIDIKSE